MKITVLGLADASERGSLHVVPCKVTCSQLVPGPCADTDRSHIKSMHVSQDKREATRSSKGAQHRKQSGLLFRFALVGHHLVT